MRKILVALVAVIAVGLMSEAANASTAPTLSELHQLHYEVSKGLAPTVRPEVIDYVHDSTRDLALGRNCAYDRNGNVLASQGEWEDADWYGKANPEKVGIDSPEAQSQKYKYRAKLAWKNGYCYLDTSTSPARFGAKTRVNAAMKQLD